MPGNRTKRVGKSGNAPAATPRKPAKIDRRVARTRNALGDAVVSLIQEKPFDSITVQQILDRAHVSRSTFYAHYSDTNDLFLSDAEDFWEMMSSMLERRREKSNRVAPVAEFFTHVADWRKFVDAMFASEKVRDVLEMGQGYFARSIAARLALLSAGRSLSAAQRTAIGHAYAGAIFSLMAWWMRQKNPALPQQMDDMFHKMLWAGIGLELRGGKLEARGSNVDSPDEHSGRTPK